MTPTKDSREGEWAEDVPRRSGIRFIGCMLVLILIVGATASAVFWNRKALLEKSRGLPFSKEWVKNKTGKMPFPSSPDLHEELGVLRQRVAEIQSKWEKMPNAGELRTRLEGVHRQLVEQRNRVGNSAKSQWNDAITRSEALLTKTRDRAGKLPRQLGELQSFMQSVERLGQVELPDNGKKDAVEQNSGKKSAAKRPPDTIKESALPPQEYKVGR